jgi:glucan biosynthesis protein C
MTNPAPPTGADPLKAPGRLAFIDNIRWVVIVLVISMHAADTYSPFGSWYYIDRRTLGVGTLLFFGTYQSFLQAFFMGLLFFIAGYFTPRSYDAKGASRFLLDRFLRLGVPTLLYMFVIGPLTEYYVAHSWRTRLSFPDAWFEHIANGEVLSGSGPLWFCVALLIFSLVYAAARQLPWGVPLSKGPSPLPRARAVLAFIAGLGISSFAVRVLLPSGSSFFNMQLTDFPQYVILFVLGLYAYRLDWLARLDTRRAKFWCAGAVLGGMLLWFGLLVFGGALDGDTRGYSGGWHWQNFGMCMWAAIICAGMSLGMLGVFRERFATQGRFARFMSANAFAVYVFHPPILIGAAIVLHAMVAPALLKFVMLTIISAAASFAAAQLVFRQIPGLKRIL